MKKWIVMLLIALAGCDANNKDVTSSGINIKYFERGTEELVSGQYLVVQTKYQTGDGKVILESHPYKPIFMKYEPELVKDGGLLQEVLNSLKVGDSVYFEIPAQNLFEVTFETAVPDSISSSENIHFYLSINQQLNTEEYFEYVSAINELPYESQYNAEYQSLLKYLADNNLETRKTKSNVHYIITNDKDGTVITDGDTVTLTYNGQRLDGSVFDQGELNFVVGKRNVIDGLDEGIRVLSVGDIATFYIPSKEGYGYRGSNKLIQPFTTLIFDVEILSVNEED